MFRVLHRLGGVIGVAAVAFTLVACGADGPDPPTPTTDRPTVEDPWTYGDSEALDVLWEACASDDASACDELYEQSPEGSDYQRFGDTCGGRTEGGGWCSEVATPTPTNEPASQSLITDLVGQPVDGAMVGALLDTHYCEIDGAYVAHYKCLADGIELSMDSALNVSSVFLFAEGVADYGEFTGSMPYGLYWGAPWSEIEAAWGPPASQFEPSDVVFDPRFTVVYEVLNENFTTITLDFTPDSRQLIQATFTA